MNTGEATRILNREFTFPRAVVGVTDTGRYSEVYRATVRAPRRPDETVYVYVDHRRPEKAVVDRSGRKWIVDRAI